MTNPTSNFNWQMPEPTDLVTNLPADFEVFGQAVDSDFADLLGGTTGQVLSKTSNTDLDFTWIANDQGDITAVTVTSPITGGGTSGSVGIAIQDGTTAQKGAVQLENSTSSTSTTTAAVPANVKTSYDLAAAAIPKSTVTTNGDLIYGTGSAAVTRLGIGSAAQVLTVSGGGVPSWAAAAGGGKLLQLVQGSYSTATTITTTTMTDTGLSLSITPTSATSKILVMINQMYKFDITGNEQGHSMRILRGATEVYATGSSQTAGYLYGNTLTSLGSGGITPLCYLDSPATTSSTTYKTQGRLQTASGSCIYQINSGTSIITLMEIGA
jgi:hypothetical protein